MATGGDWQDWQDDACNFACAALSFTPQVEGAPICVMGPGTGLGAAQLVMGPAGYTVVPGEWGSGARLAEGVLGWAWARASGAHLLLVTWVCHVLV